MILIKDDFLNEQEFKDILNFDVTSQETWKNLNLEQVLNDKNLGIRKIFKFASELFDLSDMVGYEHWNHVNTRPDWHYDKNEKVFIETGQMSFPLCSIVFYLNVDVRGGRFVTDTEIITTKTNRLICFSPGVHHYVEPFEGTRVILSINPWNYNIK